MPAGEMIGNGGMVPGIPTMGRPMPGMLPQGAPPVGAPPGAGMMPLPQMGARTNGTPFPTMGPPVGTSNFDPNNDASDFERQQRERMQQEAIRAEMMRRQGQVQQPMAYPSPDLNNFAVDLNVEADDDGVGELGLTGKFNDGAQQFGGGVRYLPGYTMDGIGRVPGATRAEVNYGTKNFNFRGGYTSGRRGQRGFGGGVNFNTQF